MKIVIIGAGKVGYSLAEYFSGMKHNITVIEKDKELCDDINSKLDVFVVQGEGASPTVLESADIESADMVIAVTPSDEVNLLACNFAMQNGVEKRIARVKSNVYTSETENVNLERLGVTSVIEAEREVMKRILQYVELPNVIESANFQSDNIFLRGYRVTSDMPIANKTLAEIRQMADPDPILIVVIVRSGQNIQPTGDQKLLPGDKIVAIMPKDSFKTFCALIDHKISKLKKVVVSGDTLTAIHLAEALKPLSEKVLLADPDLDHGRMAASALEGVEVLHIDSTKSDMLEEININHTDCFIAAGSGAEDNIMSSLLAKVEGADMVIALRDDKRYDKLFTSLGMDHIIYPQEITLNAIIEKIEMVSIATHLQLKTADIEIMRIKVSKKSPVTGKKLGELDKLFKRSIIVGCIIKENSAIIPQGSTMIDENDVLLILGNKDNIHHINKIFKTKG